MCRARPGPRCSNGGEKRYEAAKKYYDKVQLEVERDMERLGRLRPITAYRLKLAQKRLDAARKVYLSTPAGQRELADQIAEAKSELETMPKGTRYSRTRSVYNAQKREIKVLEGLQKKSANWRECQYLDLRAVGGERRQVRDKSRATGGTINMRAQPSRQSEYDAEIARDKAEALRMREWTSEDLDRSSMWAEEGSLTPWIPNGRTRPKAEHGEVIGSGMSKQVRINAPDGVVAEARADVHVTRPSSGGYRVVRKLTVASSYEDASPIDVTSQPLGHIIKAKKGINRNPVEEFTDYATEAEANRAAETARRSLNQTFIRDVAQTARRDHINRAMRVSGANKVQFRGWAVWPRYAPEKERETASA